MKKQLFPSIKQYGLTLYFILLSFLTIFLCSEKLVNSYVMPKWYGFYGYICFWGVITGINSIYRKKKVSLTQLDAILFLLYTLILIRYISIENINKEKLIFLFTTFSLYIYIKQNKSSNIFTSLFIIVGLTSLLQAIYGFIQYVGLLSSNTGFKVTGSFDNPAGYAACLSIGAIFCLYFTRSRKNRIKYLAYSSIIFIILNIILSASRAGIMSVTIILILYLSLHYKKILKRYVIIPGIIFLIPLFCFLYFAKQDSADGRRLIWIVSSSMIKDKPFWGHGPEAFQAKYMVYQGEYFKKYPDSKLAPLADNVIHPFNEILLLIIEYGIVALSLFIILILIIISRYRTNKTEKNSIAIISLIGICIFSFFSYPLKYPFTWLIIYMDLGILFAEERRKYLSSSWSYSFYIIFVLFSVFFFSSTIMQLRDECKWNKIAYLSQIGLTEKVLPSYKHLHLSMKYKGLFLYNYSAELNAIGEYRESLIIGEECEKLFNDYDLQLLIADNYYNLKEYEKAGEHYFKATYMCPNRFIPLWKLVYIYESMGEEEKLKDLAEHIINKPVKIPSFKIWVIKKEMKEKIQYHK